jgi:hypothetical protein
MEAHLFKSFNVFSNGSYSVRNSIKPPLGVKFAIVRIPQNEDPAPFDWTVMAAAVNDQAEPTRMGKGSTIPCRAFFNHMSKIMTPAAYKWAVEPNVLWINERYKGDSDWPEVDAQGNAPDDREPISECIYYPLNFIAYDKRDGDWFHLLSYINVYPPTDTETDNWIQKPWLWGKAQAISRDGEKIINVGEALDVYLPLIKHTTSTWMHISQLELLPELPYLLQDGRSVVEYILSGANVIGVLRGGEEVYLRKVGKFTGLEEIYNWHLQTIAVIPPEGF